MAEAGLFRDERVELLGGVIVAMSPQKSLHAAIVNRVGRVLSRTLEPGFLVRIQSPVILDDESEPEPDLSVCTPDPDDYELEHPASASVLLVVEVADTSLAFDRSEKAAAYAASGIPAYWLVNLIDRVVEAKCEPDPAGRRYGRTEVARSGESLSAPGGLVIAVTDLLPRTPTSRTPRRRRKSR